MVTHPASSLAQDRESSPAETSVLTTVLRRQREGVLGRMCCFLNGCWERAISDVTPLDMEARASLHCATVTSGHVNTSRDAVLTNRVREKV